MLRVDMQYCLEFTLQQIYVATLTIDRSSEVLAEVYSGCDATLS